MAACSHTRGGFGLRDKRLIEEILPLEAISEESVKEKNIKRGHISTLHVWWARKPLVACRAAVFSSLVKDPQDYEKRKDVLDFTKDLCKWENSLNQKMLRRAKRYIRESIGNEEPKFLDSFAGMGSIPLEALRLGCKTYSLDLNPVAVLINKAILEYPQKYGRATRKSKGKLMEHRGGPNPKTVDQPEFTPSGKRTQNGLFHQAAQSFKAGGPPERVKVYEKKRRGVWAYWGIYRLVDSWREPSGKRKVFKFRLEAAE